MTSVTVITCLDPWDSSQHRSDVSTVKKSSHHWSDDYSLKSQKTEKVLILERNGTAWKSPSGLTAIWSSCSCCWEEAELWVPVSLLGGMKGEERWAKPGGSWPAPKVWNRPEQAAGRNRRVKLEARLTGSTTQGQRQINPDGWEKIQRKWRYKRREER